MKKIISLLIVFILAGNLLNAQIENRVHVKAEDFKKMIKKTMIVELLEENPKIVDKLSKSKKEEDQLQLEDYKKFISYYNETIKQLIPKYWSINTEVEYKYGSDLKKLQEAKNDKYVVFKYVELKDMANNFDGSYRSRLSVPAFVYAKSDSKLYDFKVTIPSTYAREEGFYLESDLKFALLKMQEAIIHNTKASKPINFEKYIELESEKNCGRQSDVTLYLDETYLYKKANKDDAAKNYNNKIVFTTAAEVDKILMAGEEGTAAIINIPFKIIKGSMGPINSSRLTYNKVIVDAKTGEVIAGYFAGIGKTFTKDILEKDFVKLGTCK